jgi:hypothetical protein
MLREPSFKQAIYLHAVVLGLILTALGGAAAIVVQQMLRRGADQPQIQMADLYVSQLLSGEKPVDFASPKLVDIGQSLEPFVIFYNDGGQPENFTGHLDGTVPAPSSGVFDHLRSYSSSSFTWQPRPRVRIAAVARRIIGSHPGFLLVGRSLRSVEENESLLRQMTFFGWFVLLLFLALGAAFLQRAQRSHEITSS